MGQSSCVVECACLSVYVSDRVRACSRACVVVVVVVGRLGVLACAPKCGWVTIGTALGNVGKR